MAQTENYDIILPSLPLSPNLSLSLPVCLSTARAPTQLKVKTAVVRIPTEGHSGLPCDSGGKKKTQEVEALRSPQGAAWFPAPWTDPHVTVTQQLVQTLELHTLSVVVQCSQARLNTFRPISKLPLTPNHMQTVAAELEDN